ncbi:MAG: lactate racemase domain-containing protein [Candidatus Bipolaricaulaceae bacterium]
MIRAQAPGRPIAAAGLRGELADALESVGVRGERVMVVVPDDSRTLPMTALFDTICEVLLPRAESLTFLVALGTHPAMSVDQLTAHLGPGWRTKGAQVIQHAWDDPRALARVGTLSSEEMDQISRGLLAEQVPVEVNRRIVDCDLVLIVGPVFPHEVVGFSGGHKYFFPGASGPQMVHQSHWLGALITNPKVNGHRDTPVRAMIERAAAMVATPRLGLSLVMRGADVVGWFLGEVHEAWSEAADLSARVNITWTPRAYHTVLSMAPPMYREVWTAGKCMYKLEPVVADGGTLIIYAPHIRELSPTHGKWLLEVGYHVRDYFLAQWDRFRDVPRAVLAHSTHVRGIGTFRDGVERPRIDVQLATGIPPDICRRINLGYRDPRSVRLEEYGGREEEGILVVPKAGEQLWRLAAGTVPDIDAL